MEAPRMWPVAAVFVAALLAGGLTTSPARAQGNPVFGTVQVNGPVWIAEEQGWQRLAVTRPLLAGDRLKTGREGYLLADLGALGSVGMFGDTKMSAGASDHGAVIGVEGGRLAFHLAAHSTMEISAADASIHSDRDGADRAASGYVEVNSFGDAVVVVEDGSLAVSMGESERTLSQGDRLLLNRSALGALPESLPTQGAERSTGADARGAIPETVAPVRRAAVVTEEHTEAAAVAPAHAPADTASTLLAAASDTGSRERERAAGLDDNRGMEPRRIPPAETLQLGGWTITGDEVGGLTAIAFIGGAVAAGTSNDDSNGSP